MKDDVALSTWVQVKICDAYGDVVRRITVALTPAEYRQLHDKGARSGYVLVDVGRSLSVVASRKRLRIERRNGR